MSLGAITPGGGSVGFQGITIDKAPSDANVTASIEEDTSGGGFRVQKLTSYEEVLVPIDDFDLPPRLRGRKTKVKSIEIVDETDGSTPLTVTQGQMVVISVSFSAPLSGYIHCDPFNRG